MTNSLGCLLLAAFAPGAALGQTPQPPPAFEVASVKPAAPQTAGRMMAGMGGDAGRVNYTNVPLKNVLMRAYGVKIYQIAGPAWLDDERYDIVAKVPDGVPKEQIPVMLQNLLAERFRMTVRRETREQPVYALVVGKNGAKLKKSGDSPPPVSKGPGGGPAARPTGAAGGSQPRGDVTFVFNGAAGPLRFETKGMTLSSLAGMLSGMLDRPVVDMTGILGDYDITLDASMDELAGMRAAMAGAGAMPHAPADGAPAPESAPSASIFTSIQQLGLKLEPRKAPVEYIVVDKAEKVPTEN